MSIPRAATSVTTIILIPVFLCVRNRSKFSLRCMLSIAPYICTAFIFALRNSCTINSTWCLVAAKTMVGCPAGMTCFNRLNNAAAFSFLRTIKKANLKFSLTFVSVSNRINFGSLKPALANSTNAFGNVAENNNICLPSGIPDKISFNCSAKPISNKRSASSNTTHSTIPNENSLNSFKWWANLPGVATIISGLPANAAHWASIPSPPTTKQTRNVVNLHRPRAKRTVCEANSRVGDRIIARAPAVEVWCFNRLITGIKNAAVLPEPVRAIATTSWPSRQTGIVFRWTGVGRR